MSQIFDPDWKPGKTMKAKAARRARKHGIPFDQALEEQIEQSKANHLIAIAGNAARGRELADVVEENREVRRGVFPEPQSVRAIPTATETNRRKH